MTAPVKTTGTNELTLIVECPRYIIVHIRKRRLIVINASWATLKYYIISNNMHTFIQ